MAVLSDGDRAEVWKEFMENVCRNRGVFGALTKGELRLAVNAIDQWVSDNAAAFNAAIPQPARGQLTAAQKAHLLAFVVEKRFKKGA